MIDFSSRHDFQERGTSVIKGFKNFLLRGDVIVIAVGLIVALAFSTLIKAFTDSVINPLISRAQGGHAVGLGVQLGQTGNSATFLNFGAFISADRLLRHLHGRRLLRHRGSVQEDLGKARPGRVRRPGANPDMPRLSFRRPSAGRYQVQVLRHRSADWSHGQHRGVRLDLSLASSLNRHAEGVKGRFPSP